MRNNPNKVVKVITKKGPEWWQFITGKMLYAYLLFFQVSHRETYDRTTYELHALGQTKAVRFFCDKRELDDFLEELHPVEGPK